MAVLLDAYALIAVLKAEPAVVEIRPLLVDGVTVIHPLNLGEVIDKLVRLSHADADEVEADVALLGVAHTDADADVLIDAGRLRARHYHRIDRPVSLADCVAAAHSLRAGIPLATADAHLAAVMRAEGGKVVALPDSSGVRP